ncbi:hypothetical protein MASR2M29_04380 [Spirochaetota bacterium]
MNSFKLSMRYIGSRKLESSLAIAGIILGVATLAGTLSMIASYKSYYEKFSRSPEAMQIHVMQASRVRVTDEAAVLIGTSEIQNIRFTAGDAKAALDVCPDAELFYEASFMQFYTSASSSSSGGFGAFGGAPGGTPGGAPGGIFLTGGAPGSVPGGAPGGTERPGANGGPGFEDMGPPPDGPFTENLFAQAENVDTGIEKPALEKVPGAMVSGGFFRAYGLQAEHGDVFTDISSNSGSPGVVLGCELAKTVYASVSEPAELVGKKLILNNTSYTIQGVLARDEWGSSGRNTSFNNMAFVPSFALRTNSSARMVYRSVLFVAKENSNPATAAIQLENYFNSIYGQGAVVAEANLELFSAELTKRNRVLTLMAILASASALTAAVNLFNLMTSRVLRRKRAIAIMRALGAWNRCVFNQIIMEAAMIGVSGAVVGTMLSPVIVNALGSMLEKNATNHSIPVSIRLPVLLAAGFGALLVSLVFAAIPAKSGSSLLITDSLRSE